MTILDRITLADPEDTYTGNAAPDYEYWTKMPYWTLHEAAALAAEKNPIESNVFPTKGTAYDKMARLIQRAYAVGHLGDPTSPKSFITWAKSVDLQLSESLIRLVSKQNPSIDWKAEAERLDKMEKRAASGFEYYRTQSQRKDQIIGRLQAIIGESKPSALQKQSGKSSAQQKSINTLLKLVGGMALSIYAYDENNKRSDVVRSIQNDLDLKGVELDTDTIRKWVRRGVEFVKNSHSKFE